jgi:hypothetical protein
MLLAVQRGAWQPAEVGEAALLHSSRGPARRVRYQSNFDLFPGARGQLARDTLFLELPAPEEEIPRGAQCRGAWTGAAYVVVGCHYYPPCPEPHLIYICWGTQPAS